MFKKISITLSIACIMALFAIGNAFAATATFSRNITNTVSATYNDVNANAMTPVTASVTVSVTYLYGVTLTPSPSTILSNNLGTVDYAVTVNNVGNASDSFTMSNTSGGAWTPTTFTFYRDNGSGTETSTVLAGSTTDVIAAGGSQKIWVHIVIPDAVAPTSNTEAIKATSTTNTKDATGGTVAPVFDTTTLTTTTDSANLTGSTKGVDQAGLHYKANQAITYTIKLINSGTVGATGVVVTDTIPADIDTLASTYGTFSGNVFTSSAQTVAAKAGSTNGETDITITGKIKNTTPGIVDGTTLSNVASINYKSGTDTTPEPQFDTPAVVVTVDAPLLAVTKTADVSSALPNGTINYHVTVTNNGHDVANAVVIADTLSGFVTFGKILQASDGAGADSVPFINPLNCAPTFAAGVVSGNVTGGTLPALTGKAEFFYRVTVNAN